MSDTDTQSFDEDKQELIKKFAKKSIDLFKYFFENDVFDKTNPDLRYFNEWLEFVSCNKKMVYFNKEYMIDFIYHRLYYYEEVRDNVCINKSHHYRGLHDNYIDIRILTNTRHYNFIEQIVDNYFEELNYSYVLK
jgi:hypothetical protein